MRTLPGWVPWTLGGLVAGLGLYVFTRRSPALRPAPTPVRVASLSVTPRPLVSGLAPRLAPAPSLETTLAQYNLAQINQIRSARKLPLLVGDARLDTFARVGSMVLSADHVAHTHFKAHVAGAPGFGNHAAENQGDARGVVSMDTDLVRNGQKQIDRMLAMMMAEGPGGPHYDTLVNPLYRRVGFGLVTIGGRLYMTNDFSS